MQIVFFNPAKSYSCPGNLTESYVIFEKCLELTGDSTPVALRACLQTCLGMVSHMYSDLDGAKAALFKCVEIDPSFMPGLVALASIGKGSAHLFSCLSFFQPSKAFLFSFFLFPLFRCDYASL